MAVADPRLDPSRPEMQTEPARNVADFFASKAMIRTFVAALAGIVAAAAKVTVDDTLVDNIATAVLYSWPLLMAMLAKWDHVRLAKSQGEATRDVVFAPATVELERIKAYEAALPPIEDLPPPPDPARELTGVELEALEREQERLAAERARWREGRDDPPP